MPNINPIVEKYSDCPIDHTPLHPPLEWISFHQEPNSTDNEKVNSAMHAATKHLALEWLNTCKKYNAPVTCPTCRAPVSKDFIEMYQETLTPARFLIATNGRSPSLNLRRPSPLSLTTEQIRQRIIEKAGYKPTSSSFVTTGSFLRANNRSGFYRAEVNSLRTKIKSKSRTEQELGEHSVRNSST